MGSTLWLCWLFSIVAASGLPLRPLRLSPVGIARMGLELRSTLSSDDLLALTTAARDARGLAIDAVSKCKSGHLGLPLGCAEIGAVLWGKFLQYYPHDPQWLNRDRFVLSAGHGSMFLYAWLHLAGYSLTLDDLRAFRQFGSRTPGHPEFGTPGVEATTGPLGAGVSNAVGMAVAAKHAQSTYNTAEYPIFDHLVVALCGDGCMQEGVTFEAAAYAGHEHLDNLVVIYDSNHVTLDGPASATQSEDISLRFQALGWEVTHVDGHNLCALTDQLEQARARRTHKPKLIIARTVIGKGIPEVEGTSLAHGEKGCAFREASRHGLGLPLEAFHVSSISRTYFQHRQMHLRERYEHWQRLFQRWAEDFPDRAQALHTARAQRAPPLPPLPSPPSSPSAPLATRQAAHHVLQSLGQAVPHLLSGAADVFSSTQSRLSPAGDFGSPLSGPTKSYLGRNLHFGVREHGMGGIVNGMAYYGLHRVCCATFLAFADYLRPAIRLAALAGLPVVYWLSHDSVAVGEDGPTHQPVEGVTALRVLPNLCVVRPADGEEVVGGFHLAMQRVHGPTAMILTRQPVHSLEGVSCAHRREGVLRGAYVLQAEEEAGALEMVLLASGSEVGLVVEAAKRLGRGVRVVSVPCLERFLEQDEEYRESVLPRACRCRLAVEAGVTGWWHQLVGLDGAVMGTDAFGHSGAAEDVMQHFGLTVDHVVTRARALREACHRPLPLPPS